MGGSDKTSKFNSLRKTMRRFSGHDPKSGVSPSRSGGKHHTEMEALQEQVKGLDQEVYQLRRRLEQVPREFELLRAR
ncbi:MAG: proteasome ATPase, partial [Candidatus Methylomirabilales bacterium]